MMDLIQSIQDKFEYNPNSGLVTDKLTNKQLGSLNGDGYTQLWVGKTRTYAHIVAHVLMTGELPHSVIHHKDGNLSNNKWDNLDVLPRSVRHLKIDEANQNSRSGVRGVFIWHNGNGKKHWRAKVGWQRKSFMKNFEYSNTGLMDAIKWRESKIKSLTNM